MEIRSSHSTHVRAAAWLPYRGWTISLSTIPNRPEMVIWKGDKPIHHHFGTCEPTVENIIRAKSYIDNIEDQSQ